MVFLWSDILIFTLIFFSLLWFYFAIKRQYWKDTAKKIIQNKAAMISLVVLCIYVFLGITDSIHFRENRNSRRGGQIVSLLDYLCKDMIQNTEKTYSAPFALYSSSKKTIYKKDGSQYRGYPRLKHAAKGIHNNSERFYDIIGKIKAGAGFSIVFGFFLIGIYWLIYRFYQKKNINENQPSFWTEFKTAWLKKTFFLSAVAGFIFITVSLSSTYHILGTDKAGFDVFYISLKGARTGLLIGTLTTFIVTPFAIFFGVLAGYFGGWIDDIIQYIYTTLSSIPDILLIAAAMLIFHVGISAEETVISADKRLVYLCVIMGITSWTGICRLIRAEVLKLRELEYIQAATAMGVGNWKIMTQHLVPNVMHIVIITVILRFSGLVLAEAVLSYIGIGVDPTMQSWGNMINQARLELAREPVVWWNLLASCIFMLGLVLPANIFGDAVRDALDPRLKGL